MDAPTPQALKDLREKHRLSQVEMARLVYVSRRTMQYWEDGSRAIPMAAWELLNIRMGECQPVALSDLLAEPDAPPRKTPTP